MGGAHEKTLGFCFRNAEGHNRRAAAGHIVGAAGDKGPGVLLPQPGVACFFQDFHHLCLGMVDADGTVQKGAKKRNAWIHIHFPPWFFHKNRRIYFTIACPIRQPGALFGRNMSIFC